MRLSGVYLAMLTLAFAQIVWSIVFQWEELTGGSNGVIGVWPPPPFDSRPAYLSADARASAVAGVLLLRRFLFAPFGYAMRAGRDSPLRAEAIGIDVKRVHWLGFAIAGAVCGVAGGLFAFAKGSISPETCRCRRSIDGLVMVLLGGIQTLTGPIVGASVFATLQDTVMRQTEYWRALLGGIILLLVLAFPSGIVGALAKWRAARRAARMSMLSVRDLSKAFGGVRAVDDVSFDVGAGEFLALIGPNGAGKSTCFNIINGQLIPDERRRAVRGPQHRRPDAARHLAARRRPHVPGRGHVRLDDGGRERAAGACEPPRRDFPFRRGFRTPSPRPARSSCSIRSAWRTPPTAPARSWPTATSSASSWRSRSPTIRGCC